MRGPGYVEGSLEAFQRYYGTESSGSGPKLASKVLAKQMRETEDFFIGCFLLQHIRSGPNVPLLVEDDDGANTSASAIYNLLKDWYVSNRRAAIQITDSKLHNVSHIGKSVRTVVNELNTIFYEYSQSTGQPYSDPHKLTHLLRITGRMPHVANEDCSIVESLRCGKFNGWHKRCGTESSLLTRQMLRRLREILGIINAPSMLTSSITSYGI